MKIEFIGKVKDGYIERELCPRQGYYDSKHFILEIYPKYLQACEYIEPGDYLQVLYYPHTVKRDILKKVQPVTKKLMGVFSTRAPERPNPINICIAKVVNVDNDNGKIEVTGLDAMDGSPIIDIKGYLKELHQNLLNN